MACSYCAHASGSETVHGEGDDVTDAWSDYCWRLVRRVHDENKGASREEVRAVLEKESGLVGWTDRVGSFGLGWDIPPMPDGWVSPVCFERIECGGSCRQAPGHAGPHLCEGDTDGPGSCPA